MGCAGVKLCSMPEFRTEHSSCKQFHGMTKISSCHSETLERHFITANSFNASQEVRTAHSVITIRSSAHGQTRSAEIRMLGIGSLTTRRKRRSYSIARKTTRYTTFAVDKQVSSWRNSHYNLSIGREPQGTSKGVLFHIVG